MPVNNTMPSGDSCYIIGDPFGGKSSRSQRCPDYDETLTTKPKCRRHGLFLNWDRAGRVLKCASCLREAASHE